MLIDAIREAVEVALPNVLLHAPVRSYVPLESDNAFALAMRGTDNAMLLTSVTLGKRQGSNLEQGVLLQDIVTWTNFNLCRWAGTVTLVATYLTNSKALFAEKLRNTADPTVSVRISFDDSMVASMECMPSHAYTCGVIAVCPIQVRSDQSATLAEAYVIGNIEVSVTCCAEGAQTFA